MNSDRFPTAMDELAFLLEEVPRSLRRRFDERVRAHGLNRTQWRILAYLLRDEGLTQTELGRCLELERMTIGLTLDKMEEKGLVERRRCQSDRRIRRVYTKPEARELIAPLRRQADAIYKELLRGIDGENLRNLRSTLEMMAGNLKT